MTRRAARIVGRRPARTGRRGPARAWSPHTRRQETPSENWDACSWSACLRDYGTFDQCDVRGGPSWGGLQPMSCAQSAVFELRYTSDRVSIDCLMRDTYGLVRRRPVGVVGFEVVGKSALIKREKGVSAARVNGRNQPPDARVATDVPARALRHE